MYNSPLGMTSSERSRLETMEINRAIIVNQAIESNNRKWLSGIVITSIVAGLGYWLMK